jgi:hypothetical protein
MAMGELKRIRGLERVTAGDGVVRFDVVGRVSFEEFDCEGRHHGPGDRRTRSPHGKQQSDHGAEDAHGTAHPGVLGTQEF